MRERTLTLPVSAPQFNRNNRYHDWALYVQDSWKVLPTLTLDLGLRYEYYGVQHNADPTLDSNFYYGAGNNIQMFANGFVATVPTSPIHSLWEPQYHNFDPRVGFASITHVEVSGDLRHAKVFVSVMGTPEEQAQTMKGLKNATGFLRHELASRLVLRFMPELAFKLDTSIAEGARVLDLIHKLEEEEKQKTN